MLYIHESNLKTKIRTNYNSCGTQLNEFYLNEYIPMRNRIVSLHFDNLHRNDFEIATAIFNDYYNKLLELSRNYNIKSQSKFESTFLEELSSYLFKDLPDIANGNLGVFNKKIYAGLKIDSNHHISVITKDVDFCIGKKTQILIDNQPPITLILPVVAVEVKTYLDATMFGEVKSSSKAIRSASPNSKTYVLMGYKDLKDEHIIAARQDSTISEMFVLRANANSPMDHNTIYEYWQEVSSTVEAIVENEQITVPGKLLNP